MIPYNFKNKIEKQIAATLATSFENWALAHIAFTCDENRRRKGEASDRSTRA
jgi:hypothetical protein